MNNDPVIKAGVFHGELYPWRIVLPSPSDGVKPC